MHPQTITTANAKLPAGNRNELMKMHEREAEACLVRFSHPQGLPTDIAGPLAMVALAHATLAVHYSPRGRRA